MKTLDGIVFHNEFQGTSPKITVWQEGSIDKNAMPVTVLISDNKLPPKFYTEEQVDELIRISKNIIREYDDPEVLMNTPIAYFKKFNSLRELLKEHVAKGG